MIARALVAAAFALACRGAAQAQDWPPEAMAGSIEGVLFVCGSIDAKTAKEGATTLAQLVQQHKLDLSAVRKLPAYSSAYNAEVNRLVALPPTRKAEACKNFF